MHKFTVNFAKLNITVNCKFDYTYNFCKDYLSNGNADFEVSVSDEETDKEIAESPYNPSRPYAESICVYRAIAEKLPYYDRCVFHGAVISYRGRGYIFTAPSGTGKTTHIGLWQKYLDGVEIVNGDKPVLHIEEDGVTAYATPYAGKEGYQNHSSVPLCGICLLEQAPQNSIRRLDTAECVTHIMSQTYKPYDTGAVIKTLEMLDRLLRNIPVYLLSCNIGEEAVKYSFEALTNLSYENNKRPL
ncbi:MAG: hypothetical protein E7571_08865 [Ruminococcaceae bacterium]|nr:hypothetical protein [Oscillospiraceae bacterium]